MPHLASKLLTWLSTRFPNWCRDNPLAQFEIAYSARRDRPDSYWRWLTAALRYSGLLFGLILAGSVFVGSLLQWDAYTIYITFDVYGSLYVRAVIVAHFLVQFQTIGWGAISLARERQELRWDYLRLTGISDKDFIRGKWWAVVRQQFAKYLWLGALSGCAVIWFGYAHSMAGSTYLIGRDALPTIILPYPLTLLWIFGYILLLTLLNLGFTAACGLFGAALGQRGGGAFLRGVVARIQLALLPLALSCALTAIVPTFITTDIEIRQLLTHPFNMLMGTVGTIIDNGFIFGAAYSAVRYDFGFTNPRQLSDILFAIVPILLSPFAYILCIRYTLGRAERRVQILGIVKEP